jgi:signal transduction histidine kinase
MNEIVPGLIAFDYMCLWACLLATAYHAVLYIFFRDRILLHYVVYLACMCLFIFTRTKLPELLFSPAAAQKFFISINEGIQVLSFTMYCNFGVQASELTKNKTSVMYKAWRWLRLFLLIYIVVTITTNSLGIPPLDLVRGLVRLLIFATSFVILWRLWVMPKSVFQGLILIGGVYFFICGLMSFITDLTYHRDGWFGPITWLFLGNIGDLLIFSSAMGYRIKKISDEGQTAQRQAVTEQAISQQLRLEKNETILKTRMEERNRIARDMHDDLGSGLTKIAILSEVAKTMLWHPEKAKAQLESISQSSRDLVDSLQDSIWVLNPKNDSLENLAAYLREYALNFFESSDIIVQIDFPEEFGGVKLTEAERRNLFLVLKESFNNIAKHALCHKVNIRIQKTGPAHQFTIKDDGKGFDIDSTRPFGNGLQNMKNRMEQIGGTYHLESSPGKGTLTILHLPGVTLFGEA